MCGVNCPRRVGPPAENRSTVGVLARFKLGAFLNQPKSQIVSVCLSQLRDELDVIWHSEGSDIAWLPQWSTLSYEASFQERHQSLGRQTEGETVHRFVLQSRRRQAIGEEVQPANPQAGNLTLGDRVPKKKSSGNSDAHKAKKAKHEAERPPVPPRGDDKGKSKKK